MCSTAQDIHAALAPPPDAGRLTELVPELALAGGLGQGPFHHLDTLEHILKTVEEVERELDEGEIGASVAPERVPGLRLAALLHDIAKPITRGDYEGKPIFVAHDSLGAGLVHRICRKLGLSAGHTDMAATLTALHLKIGFMGNPNTDYPPERLVRAAGPFGEELAVLSWADRLAAQGPRLKDEHIERHRKLCVDFLRAGRGLAPRPEPDYEALAERLGFEREADTGYAASRLRLLEARGMGEREALRCLRALI